MKSEGDGRFAFRCGPPENQRCSIQARQGRNCSRLWATALAGFLVGFLFAQPAGAQVYPDRPIRLIVPFAAGNTGDISFRLISPTLEARLGQRFVLENRAGASGNIGAQEVARAAPDGYTLLLGATSIFVANQFMFKAASANPLSIFDPITLLADAPQLFVVNSTFPVSNLREFQSYAKGNPGKFNYSSPGIGTAVHLSSALFADVAGIDIVHIPYKGSPPAMLALLTNEAHLYVSALSAVETNLRAGKLKALAVASAKRLPSMPDVPTTAENGFPDLILGSWWGFAAPKGTDPKIIDRLATEIRGALSGPAVSARLSALGMVQGGLAPAEFIKRIQDETAKLKGTLEKLKIQPE